MWSSASAIGPERLPVVLAVLTLTSAIATAAPTRVVLTTDQTVDEAVETELAGMYRATYPYVEHVRSFNRNDRVRVAIDPHRFPELVGTTCDIWVVEARDRAGWDADPSLVDVRAGGAQSVTVQAGSLRDNRFTVAEPDTLDDDAGIGLGVPYDVVADCDRDGVLGPGDLIDGRGDEAGFYVVHDTTLPGPLEIVEATFSEAEFLTQKIYYPTDIASRGKLPLIAISHGWTLFYDYYDHIGRHLASYGYLVMSHANDTRGGGPAGTLAAAVTTIDNTDYLLANQATILGGVLNGHIDSNRIVWIGHSTGGEGVVRAYTMLRKGERVPEHYDAEDIVLLSPIAPVAWHPLSLVDPMDVNFHMFLGGADSDVSNAPILNYVQGMAIYERATGNKHLIYVQGAGHSDFDSGDGFPYREGPFPIGQEATHQVVRGYYLPLVELYARDNPAAADFLERMYDWFHPRGIPGNVIIAIEHKDGAAAANFVVDDFEANSDPGLASSGGAVYSNVGHLDEILMQDLDGSFDWTPTQPSNGMTRALYLGDEPHGIVLDWGDGTGEYYQTQIIPGQRDLSDDGYLSFRVCQGTRHPLTVASNLPLSFGVSLIDGHGVSSTIPFSSYGRVTVPYPRTGYGVGEGWSNEFSTVRIKLTDFESDGSGLDLTDIRSIRFDFGAEYGSSRGRVGIDDIEITNPLPPAPFEMSVDQDGATTRISWPRAPHGLYYNVYRGTIPKLGFGDRGDGLTAYNHRCFERGDAHGNGPRIAEDATPVPTNVAGFYYLLTAVTPEGEGSPGEASIDLSPFSETPRERPLFSICLP